MANQRREELKPRDSLGGSPRGIQYDPTRSNLNTTLEERGESSGGTSQKCLKESSVPQKLSLSIPEDAQQLSNPQEQVGFKRTKGVWKQNEAPILHFHH